MLPRRTAGVQQSRASRCEHIGGPELFPRGSRLKQLGRYRGRLAIGVKAFESDQEAVYREACLRPLIAFEELAYLPVYRLRGQSLDQLYGYQVSFPGVHTGFRNKQEETDRQVQVYASCMGHLFKIGITVFLGNPK
jgi:hypothetical protein